MRTKLLIASAMLLSVTAFAQKNELKAADKALKSGDVAGAKAAIESASSSIASADDKYKAQYYFLKGKVYHDMAKKGMDADASFDTAISSLKELIAFEEATKKKYTAEAVELMQNMTADLVNAAVEDNKNKKYSDAARKLYLSYTLSKKDTVYLYYAASSAVNGADYESALKYYNELKDMDYDGSEMKYTAVNAETGEAEEMPKTQRDLMVKAGSYTDPKDERSPSKKAEIVKNIALIYLQLEENDKAKAAFSEARAAYPNDVNLVLNEANLYLKLGDRNKFKDLMAEAAQMAPDNPDLHYNIGVVNMEQGNYEESRKAYNKAIAINPNYVNAILNLSTSYINEGNALIDEMNALGSSRADIQKYDELKKQKDDLFTEGAKVLEDGLKTNAGDKSLLEQLKNVYGALGDNDNYLRVKKLLEE